MQSLVGLDTVFPKTFVGLLVVLVDLSVAGLFGSLLGSALLIRVKFRRVQSGDLPHG